MMPDDELKPTGYGAAAPLYWSAGWRGVLPLRPLSKFPPPDGTTGHTGVDPSYADVFAWCEDFPDGNLALRLPEGVIGIDVDAYDGRNGALTLAEAEKRWGALPRTWHSSSRMDDDKVSGIRFFRVPPGTYLVGDIKFAEMGASGNVEIIQRHHRYAVVNPSIHKDTQKMYYWYLDGRVVAIPRPEDLPYLPDSWVQALRINYTSPGVELADGEAAALIRKCQTGGAMSDRVVAKLGEAMAGLTNPGGSRHDLVLKYVLTLMRYGKDGDGGVSQALAAMEQQFVAVLAVPGERWAGNPEGARQEFRRMVDNDNAARELSAPSQDEWLRNIVSDAVAVEQVTPPTDLAADLERQAIRLMSEGNALKNAGDIDAALVKWDAANALMDRYDVVTGVKPNVSAAPVPVTVPGVVAPPKPPTPNEFQEQLEAIEDGFWDSRESLNIIYKAALSRMAPPWGVLAVVAARSLCLVPPHIKLPPIIGGVGSLNSFFGLVAPSGGGKGSSVAVAKELVPHFVVERKLGSGEGFIKILEGNPRVPDSRLESVWFDAAEIDGLKAMGDRTGSTLLEKLRDAWSGASLGFGYKDDSFIEAHSYRMNLTLGVQPARAGWLLADGGGGTPQRFFFFPAFDARCTRANRSGFWIPQLALPLSALRYPTVLQVPLEVEEEIAAAHELKMQGIVDGLDSHALFAQEKLAVDFGLLDGRLGLDLVDWELAKIAGRVSVWTREMVLDGLKSATYKAAEERGELRGVEMHAADYSKDMQQVEQVSRVSRWALNKLRGAGAEGVTQSELSLAVAGRDRRCLTQTVLLRLTEDGLIRCETVEGKVRWWAR